MGVMASPSTMAPKTTSPALRAVPSTLSMTLPAFLMTRKAAMLTQKPRLAARQKCSGCAAGMVHALVRIMSGSSIRAAPPKSHTHDTGLIQNWPSITCHSRCVARGCVVRGAWCVVRGAWCVVRGTWCVCYLCGPYLCAAPELWWHAHQRPCMITTLRRHSPRHPATGAGARVRGLGCSGGGRLADGAVEGQGGRGGVRRVRRGAETAALGRVRRVRSGGAEGRTRSGRTAGAVGARWVDGGCTAGARRVDGGCTAGARRARTPILRFLSSFWARTSRTCGGRCGGRCESGAEEATGGAPLARRWCRGRAEGGAEGGQGERGRTPPPTPRPRA
eukprot:scaffold11585_cov63-Phaeocystis_antarctica.AAC.2